MKHSWLPGMLRAVAVIAALAAGTLYVHATTTDIASVPLGTSPTTTVLPNLMFVLDDSGSMAQDYTPDQVNDNGTCKSCTSGSCNIVGTNCVAGFPPYFAGAFNIQYYNPATTYKPGVTYLGASLGNMSPTSVKNNPYNAADLTVFDIVNAYTDMYYCTSAASSPPTTAQFNDTTICKRNGINTANPFNYFSAGLPDTTFRVARSRTVSNPYYYSITPTEHCTDASLTVCTASTVPVTVAGVIYNKPAPMRWCRTTAAATAAAPVTGGSPATCRANVDATYNSPRFGTFTRVDILPATATYPRATSRTDCTGAFGATGCSYAEELQNFANWYGYYRQRMLQMKTVSGRVFSGLDERYRIGFLTIHATSSAKYLPIGRFETTPTTQKQDWFTKFYAQTPASATPLRTALSLIGRHYAGVTSGMNSFMPEDPIQYSCQRNYTLLTTDGYWNTGDGQYPDGSIMGNEDNAPGTFVSRATGTLDGVGTVATVATPTVTLRQQICVGNANTTFPVSNTPCGCTGNQTRVVQQTRTDNANVLYTDGIQTSTSNSTAYTFQNISGCTTPNISTTTTTGTTRVEQQVVTFTANSTFTAVNGVSAGMNQAGTCPAGQSRVKQRTTTWNSSQDTIDGVVQTATTSGTTYAFANIGSCVLPATTRTTTRIRETEQWVGRGNSANPTTGFGAAANGDATEGTTITFPRCASGSTQKLSRAVTYDKFVDVTNGVSTTTYSATIGSAAITTVTACSGTAKSVSNPNPIFTTIAGPTNSTSGGPDPVAAATTNTPGTDVVTNNGGTTVTIPLSPNPSVPVVQAPVTTTSLGGASNTLADVAMFYYKTDLRPQPAAPAVCTVCTNNVKGPNGTFLHQHMETFTMGLGLDGEMTYDPNYETATSGDFVKIKNADTTCAWTTGTCNWPLPIADAPSAIDDLWHAAVNGRGKYFSAKDPASLENGLTSTLAAINEATGAAASAATSTPNLTPTDNLLFSSTYRTGKWDGEIIAQRLDPTTGALLPAIEWSAATQLNARGSSASDSRTIYTLDTAATSKLKSFLYGSLSPTEQAYFDNKCNAPGLPQCGALDPTRTTAANLGTNLVNWLRGQRGNELSIDLSTGFYRQREFILGDTVNSKPVFLGKPTLSLADAVTPDYPTFKAAQAGRQKMLYVEANDGMLHALNADTGAELWAYVPKMVMPNLWKLASKSYDIGHVYSADGSPATTDMFLGGAWKTILVSGLNSGGRGYFALDVTDPTSPEGLWEICSDAALCAVADVNMGLSFGTPVITKRFDGTPIVIVASGYNNVTPGDGGGYLYVLNLATGAVIEKVGTTISGTNVGSTTTPSGFAKPTGIANNFIQDNTATAVYGGDLLGNVWRFDMSGTPITVQRLAQLKDGSSPARPQSITTRPEVTTFNAGFNVLYVGTGRLLGGTDLGDAANLSPPEPYAFQQSIYGIKDTGADLGDVRLPGANLVQQVMSGTISRSVTNNPVDFATKNGWYIDLNPGNASPGERVNLDPTLLKGVLVVTTNEPNTQACSEGGNGFLYQFDYRSGAPLPGSTLVGGQISSSLLVGSVFYTTTTGAVMGMSRQAGGGEIKTDVKPGAGGGSGQRVSWRELVQ